MLLYFLSKYVIRINVSFILFSIFFLNLVYMRYLSTLLAFADEYRSLYNETRMAQLSKEAQQQYNKIVLELLFFDYRKNASDEEFLTMLDQNIKCITIPGVLSFFYFFSLKNQSCRKIFRFATVPFLCYTSMKKLPLFFLVQKPNSKVFTSIYTEY